MIHLNPIFSSFVATSKLELINKEDLVQYTYDIINLTENSKIQLPGEKFTTVKSQSLPLNLQEPVLQPLLKGMQDCFSKIYNSLELKTNKKIVISNLWCNINNNDNIDRPHIHPESFLSAIFYLKADKDNSEIVFQNPVTPIQYVIHGSLVDNFNQFNSHLYKVQPETDLALFFPGWLRHYVAKNHASDRISYAFDTKVVDND